MPANSRRSTNADEVGATSGAGDACTRWHAVVREDAVEALGPSLSQSSIVSALYIPMNLGRGDLTSGPFNQGRRRVAQPGIAQTRKLAWIDAVFVGAFLRGCVVFNPMNASFATSGE